METFFVNTPKANGVKKIDKIEVFTSILGYGKENAIKRADLVDRCVGAGIIEKDVKDKDRAMRKIMRIAKLDFNIQITNDGKGEGYYIPTFKESIQLTKNNKREDRKAVSIFAGNKGNKALAEDYRNERITE